jgi:hypothetical protein
MESTQQETANDLLTRLNQEGKPFDVTEASAVTTHIGAPSVQPTVITTQYITLPGNNPSGNGNYVAIWQNSAAEVPYDLTALNKAALTGSTPSGNYPFTKLQVATLPYVIGLAVGPMLTGQGQQPYGNVCAWVSVPNQQGPNVSFDPSVTLAFAGQNTVVVNYELPDNCTPLSNGAWLAIWQSGNPSYTAKPLMAIPASSDSSSDVAAFNGLTLKINTKYTVALFTSGYNDGTSPTQTAMAAYTTFGV